MNIILTLATVAISIFTLLNYLMYRKIQQRDEEYKGQTRDLFQGIIVATLISAPTATGGLNEAIKAFKQYYKGETKIFD